MLELWVDWLVGGAVQKIFILEARGCGWGRSPLLQAKRAIWLIMLGSLPQVLAGHRTILFHRAV